MLGLALDHLVVAAVHELLPRVGSQHLVSRALGAAVDSQQGEPAAERHEEAAAALGDVGARVQAEGPAGLRGFGLGRHALVLEQHVVLEGDVSQAREDGRGHEVVRVRAEAVDDVVVVVHVDHGDLRVGHAEEALGEPHAVALQIKGLELVLQLRREGRVVLVYRVADGQPLPEDGGLVHDDVVVDLVAAPDHDVEGPRLVRVEHVAPQRVGPAELVGRHAQAEAVAAVEHDVHGLATCWYPEARRRPAVDAVRDALLLVEKLHLDVEAPEREPALRVQPEPSHVLVLVQLLAVLLRPLQPASERPRQLRHPRLERDVGRAAHFFEQAIVRLDPREILGLLKVVYRPHVESLALAAQHGVARDRVDIFRRQHLAARELRWRWRQQLDRLRKQAQRRRDLVRRVVVTRNNHDAAAPYLPVRHGGATLC